MLIFSCKCLWQNKQKENKRKQKIENHFFTTDVYEVTLKDFMSILQDIIPKNKLENVIYLFDWLFSDSL